MKEQKSQSQIPSTDTLTTVSGLPVSGSAHDAPPRGSALLIETALTYARKARNACAGLKEPIDCLDVVIEQLEEVREKIDRQRALGSTQ